jgi:arginine N-succinyltransferase
MFVLRPLETHDLPNLQRFAEVATVGITNLPNNPEFLNNRIEGSLAAFSPSIKNPVNEYYGFALENSETKEVVGTSGIFSKMGAQAPHYCYSLTSHHHNSKVLRREWEEELLTPTNFSNGPSEICALFLHPDHRQGGIGRLLSLARFLFMAQHPHRFDEDIAAEMRGVSTSSSDCPFWNHVGRHFLDVDFGRAIELYTQDSRILPEILPSYPIHLDLLPQAARDVVGRAHLQAAPALGLLQAEGFSFNGQVDIFDAGPTISTALNDVRTVKESQEAPVAAIIPEAQPGEKVVISNTSLSFRGCLTQLSGQGAVEISEEVAQALEVKEGDSIRWAYAYPKRKTP